MQEKNYVDRITYFENKTISRPIRMNEDLVGLAFKINIIF